jgi:hypothetical protein
MHRPPEAAPRRTIPKKWFAIGAVALAVLGLGALQIAPRQVFVPTKIRNYSQLYLATPHLLLFGADYDQRTIERLLLARLNESFACFSRAEQTRGDNNLPAMQTTIVRFFIEPDGNMKVTCGSALDGHKPQLFLSHNYQVSTCIMETFRGLHFPAHDGNEAVEIQIRYDIQLLSR